MRVVFPSEDHLGFGDGENAVVGNGYAVGVASQIVQDVFGSAEWWLGVDDPVFSKQGAQECPEVLFVGQREAFSVERQLLGEESASQSDHELSAKHTAENPDRQKEAAWSGEPALMIR